MDEARPEVAVTAEDRPLHIALVGAGHQPIPPVGWGAAESIIWEYSQRLPLLGHHATVVNCHRNQVFGQLLRAHRRRPIDWVWTHHERAISGCLLAAKIGGFRVAETGHAPFDPLAPVPRQVRRQFAAERRASYHLCLNREQAFALGLLDARARVALQPNGAEVERFRFSEGPGNGRALCVGLVSPRKRQFRVAELVSGTRSVVDFVGPSRRGPVPAAPPSQYLGEWTREALRERMTEYSALVLYSEAEAQPLAVAEALAAGLSVVLSPQSVANLDTSRPFVYVVGQDEDLAPTIARAVAENPLHRLAARRYAEAHFDWTKLAERLVRQLREWSRVR